MKFRPKTEHFYATGGGSFFVPVQLGGVLVFMPFVCKRLRRKTSSQWSDSLENAIL